PYIAMRYQPSAILIATSVPNSKELRERLTREWGKITPQSHRDSLIRDMDSGDHYRRNGASIRLAYYHPGVFEAEALRQLARPYFDRQAASDVIWKKLYPAKTAKERKTIVEDFALRHGEIGREGIRWFLYEHLDRQEAYEEDRLYPKDDERNSRYIPRQC